MLQKHDNQTPIPQTLKVVDSFLQFFQKINDDLFQNKNNEDFQNIQNSVIELLIMNPIQTK